MVMVVEAGGRRMMTSGWRSVLFGFNFTRSGDHDFLFFSLNLFVFSSKNFRWWNKIRSTFRVFVFACVCFLFFKLKREFIILRPRHALEEKREDKNTLKKASTTSPFGFLFLKRKMLFITHTKRREGEKGKTNTETTKKAKSSLCRSKTLKL